jgi:hypothetical protein
LRYGTTYAERDRTPLLIPLVDVEVDHVRALSGGGELDNNWDDRVHLPSRGMVRVRVRRRHLELDLNKRLHPRTRQIRLDGVLCPVLDAYITDAGAGEWQSAIDIVLRRFAEYQDLECAFGRRAVTERAKGTLMGRHSVDETVAFDMLRQHSRATNRKFVDVATAVVDGHRLLPRYAEARSDI